MREKYQQKKKVLKHPYWHRQEWESELHHAAFQIYRDTPVDQKRSIEEVSRKMREKYPDARGTTERNMQFWHKADLWARRALAFDRYLDSKRVNQIIRRTVEMHERHSVIAVAMQQLVAERLKTLDPDQLTARDIKEWMEVASRVELRARGESTDVVRHEMTDGRETVIARAQEFFKKMQLESPGMSDKDKAAIIKESFDVEPHEIGLAPDILTVQNVTDAVQ